jgi:hypothetical protein
MAFTAGELANIANAALDFYIRGPANSNIKQARPLTNAFDRAKKTFPGGKAEISGAVKGVYTTALSGYTHDDQVTYNNPANILRCSIPWREHHAGVGLTMTELKIDGISVTDSMRNSGTSKHSQRELTVLAGLLEDKMEDMMEGYWRSLDALYHDDGTTDAKALAGIAYWITDAPATGTVGGIDAAANAWWRNRSLLLIAPATTPLASVMHTEMRQLRRFGGRPNLIIAGSDFLDALQAELLANGIYTQTGWNRRENTDMGMAEVSYNGLVFQYDPGLDDAGKAKYCYVIDTKHLFPYVMDQEDMKRHNPARPHDQYTWYTALTTTCQLYCNQRNAQGVYSIA